MKKLLTITAVGAILSAPATAVQKCVALDASTTTCTSTALYGFADWSATCTTNDTSVPIRGVAMCSIQNADATYGTLSTIRMASNATDTGNVNCWCKMASPVVSPWLFVYKEINAGTCRYNCSFRCASLAKNDPAFRSALFGSIAN